MALVSRWCACVHETKFGELQYIVQDYTKTNDNEQQLGGSPEQIGEQS